MNIDFYFKFVAIFFGLVLAQLLPTPTTWASPRVEQRQGEVVYVQDGDSLKIRIDNKVKIVRLRGIDAPEKGQPFAEEASLFVRRLTLHQHVTMNVYGEDKYHRILAEVFMKDGLNLNQELVRKGLAWPHIAYTRDKTLHELEREAREAKRGLWVDNHPEPPWVWKRRHDK
ncbi:MAG: thermonuclease family protein [Magnetococcales bacterium]|nr:thermonuclease family protein [Magnetococcales bacterium]